MEFQWLKPLRIIDSVKEYDTPKFLRQEKRAERTDFAKKCEKRTYFIDCLWLERVEIMQKKVSKGQILRKN